MVLLMVACTLFLIALIGWNQRLQEGVHYVRSLVLAGPVYHQDME